MGEVIADRYEVEGLCGHGSFGRVLRCRDLVLDRAVALKEFVRRPGQSDGFLRELGLLFDLEHPHVITCESLVMSPHYRYLVCELMDAGSLRDQFEVQAPDPVRLLRLVIEAMEGVAYAHGRDIIHRDLKPENILLRRTPDGALRAKVSDFGIAAMGLAAASRSAIGSPAYMAPEQFFDTYDHRVDIYALGVIIYEIVCGRRPFVGSPAQIMMAHVKRTLEVPAWVPRGLTRVLKKALAKQPDRRFDSVPALAEALRMALTREGAQLAATSWPMMIAAVDQLAVNRAGIFVAGGGRIQLFDRTGRLIDERRGDHVITSEGWYVVRDGEAAHLCSEHGQRKLGDVHLDARLALSREGSLAISHEGGLAVSEHGVRSEVLPRGSGVTSVAFVGAAAQLGVVRARGRDTELTWGTARVELPEPVDQIWGHPFRDEVIARSAAHRDRLFLVRPGRVLPIRAECGDFTCDGETFFAVARDGELVSVAPSSGRLARTRWEKPLAAVAACTDNLAWVTLTGHLCALSFTDGGTP